MRTSERVGATTDEPPVTRGFSSPADEHFSRRLNARMVARNLITVAELSERSGVPARTIERWLSGESQPRREQHSAHQLKAISRELRTSPLFLLTGERK